LALDYLGWIYLSLCLRVQLRQLKENLVLNDTSHNIIEVIFHCFSFSFICNATVLFYYFNNLFMRTSFLSFFLICFCFSFAQWNPNTSINLEVAGLNVSDQQCASTTDGKTWIAFYTQNGTGNYDMRAQLLDANGIKLLGSDGVLVSNQTSGSATFVFNVAVDIFNNLVVAFQYEVSGVMKAVVTKVNTDGTLPWGTGVIVGDGLAPYPAVTKTNEVIVAWNNNSPSTSYIQKIDNSGTIAWASPVAVLVGTSNTTRCQLVCNSNGDFTAVFQRRSFGISTTLYAQRYSPSGVPIWASPIQICNQTSSGARYYSIMAIGNTTYFGYYVASGSRFFAYVQKINADGTLPWGINGSAVTTYSSGTDPMPQTTQIAHDINSPYLWSVSTFCNTAQSQYGVYVQKFDTASGTRQLAATGKEVYPISTNFDTQAGELSLINDAPFFMSYDVNYKIYATRLNSSGDFVWAGNRIELSSTTSGPGNPKGRFAFTKAVGNQSVAVWYENRGVEYRSYAQAITASGVLDGEALRLNGKANLHQNNIDWVTEGISNFVAFVLEKSEDGRRFEPIYSVGINNNAPVYTYTDYGLKSPINYYRVKAISTNSRSAYSNIVVLKNDQNGINPQIRMLYPNPVVNQLGLQVQLPFSDRIEVVVIDASGKQIQGHIFNLPSGNNNIVLDTRKLTRGCYHVKMTARGFTTTKTFMKD
jgi:hypothetical protein